MKTSTALEHLLSLHPDPATREQLLLMGGRMGLPDDDIRWDDATIVTLVSGLPTQEQREKMLALPAEIRGEIAPIVAKINELANWLTAIEKNAVKIQKTLDGQAMALTVPLHDLIENLNRCADATGTIAHEHVKIRDGWEKSLQLSQRIQAETIQQSITAAAEATKGFGTQLVAATVITILTTVPIGVIAGFWAVSKIFGGGQ